MNKRNSKEKSVDKKERAEEVSPSALFLYITPRSS